jgi:hypothetical protein
MHTNGCQGYMVRQTNDVPQPSSLFASAPGLNQEHLAFILAKRHACSEETAPVSEHVPGFLCHCTAPADSAPWAW